MAAPLLVMEHTHHGYGLDEKVKIVKHTHPFTYRAHDHAEEFLAIYLDDYPDGIDSDD